MATRQTSIPGTERKQNRSLNAAAEAYVIARDERIEKTEAEVAAKEALIREMKKAGESVYRDDDAVPPLIVTLQPGEDSVKVTRAKDESEAEAEPPKKRVGRSAAAASADPLEAEADRILANAGHGKLNDPKLKGPAAKHRKARTRTAKEVGATT